MTSLTPMILPSRARSKIARTFSIAANFASLTTCSNEGAAGLGTAGSTDAALRLAAETGVGAGAGSAAIGGGRIERFGALGGSGFVAVSGAFRVVGRESIA